MFQKKKNFFFKNKNILKINNRAPQRCPGVQLYYWRLSIKM